MEHSEFKEFATTNWSVVLAASDTAPARALDAMERLCSRYWFPVYAFIRRYGNDVHQSEDLTQGFFEFAIRNQLLQQARRDKGRFRNFILTSLNHYLHNQHDRATAAKRGGRHQIVSLDDVDAEKLLSVQPPTSGTREESFDRNWAVTLLRRTLENLREEFAARGRSDMHDALLPYLTSKPPPGELERIATALAVETGTLRVALHRFRHRFGELLRSEVAYTVAEPDEVEEEIRYLLSVLAGD